MKIALIGSGNVASILGAALKSEGHRIAAVWSRTPARGKKLASGLHSRFFSTITSIPCDCDLYIIAVNDDQVRTISKKLEPGKGMVVHTSGFSSIHIFEGKFLNCGVMWPLQTFSKGRKIRLRDVPFFIEGNSVRTTKLLRKIASGLSRNVIILSSKKRRMLHLAAVFASNFSNHCFAVAEKIAKRNSIPFSVLHPLITETVLKAMEQGPSHSQTGPAVRKDERVMKEHLRMLSKAGDLRSLYRHLSRAIRS